MDTAAEHLSAPSNRPPPRLAASSLVQTQRFIKDPFTLLAEAAAEYGDVFSVRLLGLGEWAFVCSPELVRQMFKAPTDALVAGEVNRKLLGFILGLNATFPLDGDDHRKRQRLVHPHLNGRKTHQHIPAMREIALRTVESLPRDCPFAFLPLAHRMSLDVMVHAMFSNSSPRRLVELASQFEAFATKGLRSPLINLPFLRVDLGRYSPWGRVLRMKQAITDAFSVEIEHRVANRDGGAEEASDMMTELGQLGPGQSRALPDEALIDEIINLIFAGHETTGNTLAWSMETLHSHPEVLTRLREELEVVLRGQPIEASHLPDLKYLHAVIHETIRFRPMAPMAGIRLAKKPIAIGPYVIPKGMLVTQCFPVMSRREELFENPDCFDPNHFFERKFTPYEWNPFGGGTRMCIGKGLAEIELKVILATLLQHADFQLGQTEVKPVRNGHFFSPSQGLQLLVKGPR